MFQWGILSTAKIGRESVIPAIQNSDNGQVRAIASRDLSRAQALAQRFSVSKAYGSYEELLADPEIDGVYIPLPTSQHIEWSLRALDSGKHVLCEKPIALQADEILPLIEKRNAFGKVVSEAFMVTYHPQWHKVRQLLAEGAIGRLCQVQGAFSYHNDDPGNMRNILELGGGGLPDIGVYPTVTTRFVTTAEPLRVRSSVYLDPRFGTDIYADVTADFGSFTLSFYCATQMAARQFMVFHGDKGYIQVTAPFNAIDYAMPEVILHNDNYRQAQVWRFSGVQQYRLQCEAFVRAAQDPNPASSSKENAVFSLEDSFKNQKLIDAVYRAAEKDDWELV